MTTRAASLKKLADAAEPLYKSLDDGQKRRFAVLLRMGGRSGGRPRPLAAPRRQRPLRRPTDRLRRTFLLPDERRAPEAAGHVSGGFFLFSAALFLQMGCIAGQRRAALLQDASLRGSPASRPGRIAQLVEQLTLNQRVPGSSPGAPTKLLA